MSRRDQLQIIASIVSDRMDDFDGFEDIYISDRTVGFGYDGVQYSLSFWFDGIVGYNCTLDNYAAEVDFGAMTVGRMLRGDFIDLKPFIVDLKPFIVNTRSRVVSGGGGNIK